MLNSPGWKNIIGPIMDKMIQDVVGYKKESGEWDSGSFGDKRLGNVRAEHLLWYRQALIEFSNRIHSYIILGKGAQKRLEAMKTRQDAYSKPMITDSSYAPKEFINKEDD